MKPQQVIQANKILQELTTLRAQLKEIENGKNSVDIVYRGQYLSMHKEASEVFGKYLNSKIDKLTKDLRDMGVDVELPE